MNKTTLFVILAAVGAMSTGAAWTLRTRHEAPRKPPRVEVATSADDALPAPTRWDPPAVEIARAPTVAAGGPSVTSAADAAAVEAPRAAQLRPPTPKEMRDEIEIAFMTEAVDSGWSRDARHALESTFRNELPAGSSVESVECRTSLCRIETKHADKERYVAWVRTALMDQQARPWNGPLFAAVDPAASPGAEVHAVAYLAREGMGLPAPEGLP